MKFNSNTYLYILQDKIFFTEKAEEDKTVFLIHNKITESPCRVQIS